MRTGQRITEGLAAKASEASVTGARALSKNAYKIPLTRDVVRRAATV
jgi:CO/xanthine dehydrogenase FAD-binding subunit